jgi:P-type Ca2+ transporter type 2C
MSLDTKNSQSAEELQGLPSRIAAERLCHDGPNELPQDKSRGLGRILFDAMREPMLQLLVAASVIYLFLGSLAEALILLGFALVNIGLVVVQESRTERALAALRDLTSPQAVVVRDGRRERILARDLVEDDLIVLSEGGRVPADALLIEAINMQADESLLTGESVPVSKTAASDAANSAIAVQPGGDDSPYVWAGSMVVAGKGLARVLATGPRTAIGKIGTSLGIVETAPTPLQVQTRRLVWFFAGAGIAASALLATAYGILHGDWLSAVLAGITLAMATLPEEFPVVLAVFLVLGAWRISKHHVLARRASAIEALGTATILCSDKTGTMTLNKMSVVRLVSDEAEFAVTQNTDELPEGFHNLVEFAILGGHPDLFDPMERALHDLGRRCLFNSEHMHSDWTVVRSYPLQPELLAMSQVWRTQSSRDSSYVVAAKGAPEALIELCHLDPSRAQVIKSAAFSLAAEGLRVLGVAKATFEGQDWPESQRDFAFSLLGLVGLADPLRAGVAAAVTACRTAGIRVAMVTGDHPATARAIARQAGIPADDVLTGQEMASLDDAQIRERIRRVSIFARIMPEQKLRLVRAFAAIGHIVAMTGDGVNDAPSLKAAHIGVAMGRRGTDVAREAASLVLLDDDFTSLVAAVRLGRRIDDNLRKAICYILAVHVPIAGMSLIPVLFGWPLLLGPIHVVFLELIIDPVSSIVFEAEPEAPGIMARPPRDPSAPLFSLGVLARGLFQGTVVLAMALVVFRLGIDSGHKESIARAMAFVTLVLGNLGLVLTNRSLETSVLFSITKPNGSLGVVFVTALMALATALTVPWFQSLFAFDRLNLSQFLEAAGAAIFSIIINDVISTLARQVGKACKGA